MNQTHSQGPWEIEKSSPSNPLQSFHITAWHGGGDGAAKFNVATLTHPYNGTAEANVHLMAAAPAMLMALEKIQGVLSIRLAARGGPSKKEIMDGAKMAKEWAAEAIALVEARR